MVLKDGRTIADKRRFGITFWPSAAPWRWWELLQRGKEWIWRGPSDLTAGGIKTQAMAMGDESARRRQKETEDERHGDRHWNGD
jgi:hypothetical protein